MLSHPREPGRVLVNPADLVAAPNQNGPLPEPLARHAPALRRVAQWAEDYLSEPHPELGRTGPVCPFVPTSLKTGAFYLTVVDTAEQDGSAVVDAVAVYREWFGELEPTAGRLVQFKTILLLFPDVPPNRMRELIDGTQAALKPAFVASGLMIGQFHPLPPDEGGLRNPDFRPLHSPVPLLAIRHMVPSDLPFLVGDERLVDAYRKVFALERIP